MCFSDELDPIQAMAFEDYAYEDNWEKAGFEEGFEVEWTQANYELPHVSGVARLYFVLICQSTCKSAPLGPCLRCSISHYYGS